MLVGKCVTWLHSRGNDREQVCGHNSLAWRLVGKCIPSFVGGELSLLKLGSILVGLSGGVSNFFQSQHGQNYLF